MNAPRYPLKSLDDARAALLQHATALTGTELVPVVQADGRVLAQDVVAQLQVPPVDNTSMDGYAVRSADVAQVGAVLQVTQRIAAGAVGVPLAAGCAARIFTGAPIPPGADAVVMQEDCDVLEPQHQSDVPRVRINTSVSAGQWIRRSGEDVTQGRVVLSKGERLSPASIGLAASIGLDQLLVARRPRVALFSTGDELVMPGTVAPQDMKPGSIYNSNRYFLRAMLLRLGCEVTDAGIVPDRREATLLALQSAAQSHDLILTSGGVSVGEEDHIKPAVEALGQLDLWQIAMKPGKPFAYGHVNVSSSTVHDRTHFMGLPGNPVSSFITFLLLVHPFLLKLQGMTQVTPQPLTLRANFNWPRADKRREFLRVKRNDQGTLDLFPNQSSGVLTSAVWGEGVVDNPGGCTIATGDAVQFIPFSQWLS